MKNTVKRSGIKCIANFEKDEVVGIVVFRNKIVIATRSGVFLYPGKNKPKGGCS